MTLQIHDEIKRVAHAIITEYVRSYPAMPHTEVLAKFVDRLGDAVLKLIKPEGDEPLQASPQTVIPGEQDAGDPNAPAPDGQMAPTPPLQHAISNEGPAGGVQTSGLAIPVDDVS
jgi:hypothetical protein